MADMTEQNFNMLKRTGDGADMVPIGPGDEPSTVMGNVNR